VDHSQIFRGSRLKIDSAVAKRKSDKFNLSHWYARHLSVGKPNSFEASTRHTCE